MRWQKKLTKKQLRHLKEMEIATLAVFRATREHQKRYSAEHPDAPEPCWECRMIESRLTASKN